MTGFAVSGQHSRCEERTQNHTDGIANPLPKWLHHHFLIRSFYRKTYFIWGEILSWAWCYLIIGSRQAYSECFFSFYSILLLWFTKSNGTGELKNNLRLPKLGGCACFFRPLSKQLHCDWAISSIWPSALGMEGLLLWDSVFLLGLAFTAVLPSIPDFATPWLDIQPLTAVKPTTLERERREPYALGARTP